MRKIDSFSINKKLKIIRMMNKPKRLKIRKILKIPKKMKLRLLKRKKEKLNYHQVSKWTIKSINHLQMIKVLLKRQQKQ